MSFSSEQNASGFGGQPDKNPTTEQQNPNTITQKQEEMTK